LLTNRAAGAGPASASAATSPASRLARPAATIHLNEVISVLDYENVETHCKSYAGVLSSCVHTGDCGIRPVIVGLHEIVANALSQITLAQLVGTESSVDAMFHSIKGINRTIEPASIGTT